MVTAPIAGVLADRFGNRPFMVLGLALQAVGFAWMAVIASPDVGMLELAAAMVVAGVGISMIFPTVANAVVGAVPAEEVGVASGANNALREVGGVFGVAIVAVVFAQEGAYSSPQAFADGFAPALFVCAVFSAIGIVVALLAPRRRRAERPVTVEPEPELVGSVADR